MLSLFVNFFEFIKNKFNLNIASEANIKVVNILDLTLNLSTGKYEPYNQPHNRPLYINVNSNHPQNIIKKLSESISRHISKVSSDEIVFNNSKKLFSNALSNSGFELKIKFQSLTENQDHNGNKNRGRSIVWFSPLTAVMQPPVLVRSFYCYQTKIFQKHLS